MTLLMLFVLLDDDDDVDDFPFVDYGGDVDIIGYVRFDARVGVLLFTSCMWFFSWTETKLSSYIVVVLWMVRNVFRFYSYFVPIIVIFIL